MSRDEDGTIYILFVKGIARIDPQTHEITMLAESPVPISPGGDILHGRIYFGSGSHVYSWEGGTGERREERGVDRIDVRCNRM